MSNSTSTEAPSMNANTTMNHPSLLVELQTEELPPHALVRLAESFAQGIHSRLAAQHLVPDAAEAATIYATPRRLAVHLKDVRAQADAREIRVKGPSAAVGLDANGDPTMALKKWAEKQGAAIADLKRENDGKQDVFVWTSTQPGARLADVIGEIIIETLGQLPIPKFMTYQLADGLSTVSFVRPAHRLVVLHGNAVLPCKVLGLDADRVTDGHRFLSNGPITLRDADSYAAQLREEGRVEPDCHARRVMIANALAQASHDTNGMLAVNSEEQQQAAALLDEVTALVEWPAVFTGKFDPEFLQVPQECLILSMRTNQRYFPLFDADNRLKNQFLIVSNMPIDNPTAIIVGNERVVRPRLADAQFFFEQDRQQTLASRVPQLASVVYHARLGSQAERSERIQQLAAALAPLTGAAAADAVRAAQLAKTDLLTGMVGEFPELQGIMGRYYALHDGEPEAVAAAIAEHYQPRFAGDALPASTTGLTLALADKLETLAGIWGIGQRPTGDKDPFALRRHALGVIRILIESKLPVSVRELLTQAFAVFKTVAERDALAVQTAAAETANASEASPESGKGKRNDKGAKAPKAFENDVNGLERFFNDRLRSYLRDRNHGAADIDAVLAAGGDRLDLIESRLSALASFRMLPAFEALTAANKRIANILRKSLEDKTGDDAARPAAQVDASLLGEDAEKALHQAVVTLQPVIDAHMDRQEFTAALQALAALQAPVDTFFDKVMVNVPDAALRQNRLALLALLHGMMNRVADLSLL